MEETVDILTHWHPWPGLVPVTPAPTGEMEVPVLRELRPDEFTLDVCIYRDDGKWINPWNGAELEDIVAWANITCGVVVTKLRLKPWQVRSEKALEEGER